MKSAKIAAIRLYAKDPQKTAQFYSALGFEIDGDGTSSCEESYDFPLYVSLNEGPMLEIYQLDESALPLPVSGATMLIVEVQNVRQAKEAAEELGVSTAGREPRVTEHRSDRVLLDPEGRLTGLDDPFLAILGKGIPPWSALIAATYYPGQLVSYDRRTYRCIQRHTAEEGQHPASLPAFWELAVFS
jgi:hypothetical protein